MADTFGELQIPVQVPAAGEEISDPAVTLVVQFLAACLNTYGQTAWSAVAPTITGLASVPQGLASPVVRQSFGHNPAEYVFNEAHLPALYGWREGGDKPTWLAEDWRVDDDTWTILWLFRPAQQQALRLRQSFVNGIAKIVDAAIERQRDPSFVALGDTDPTAATTAADPDAIKLSVASSTSAQSYSGAALDGTIGGSAFAPAQLPTVTVTGVSGTGTVSFTGLGADGNARVSRVALSGTGTFTGDFALTQVTQIDVTAQANTAGTLAFGLGGFTGLGTHVFALGNFVTIEVAKWAETRIVVEKDDKDPATYEGVKITLHVVERWVRDVGDDTQGVATQFTTAPSNTTDNLRETALDT